MGYLLKEALKSLCGVNHWSYAVFWKIGCQNPKLLIWEECYHGILPCSNASSTMGDQGYALQKLEGGEGVRLLVDKMMMTNQISMVGEGLVGRAAFTGNHQWIVSSNYNESAHPAEVLNEIRLQFSAGMQTIAVIPVLPHGVVQLGSHLRIMENVGFVHEVKSLILQVGCVPGVLISNNYMAKNASSMYGLPAADATTVPLNLHGNRTHTNSSPVGADSLNLPRNSFQALKLASQSSNSLLTQFQDNLQVSGSTFMVPNLTQDLSKSQGDHYAAKISVNVDSSVSAPSGLGETKVNRGIVNNLGSIMNSSQSSVNCRSSTLLKQAVAPHGSGPEGNHMLSSAVSKGGDPSLMSGNGKLAVGLNAQHGLSVHSSTHDNIVFDDVDSSIRELVGLINSGNQLSSNNILGLPNQVLCNGDSEHPVKHNSGKVHDTDVHEAQNVPSKTTEQMRSGDFIPGDFCSGSEVPSSKDPVPEDVFFQPSAGDDLYDVLGVDFKNKLLSGNDGQLQDGFGANIKGHMNDLPRVMNLQTLGSEIYSHYYGVSESGVFSSTGSDHLLDAVISGVSSVSRQVSDDNTSCRTNMSKMSSPSVLSTPHSNPPTSGLVSIPDQLQGQLYGLSKPMVRLGEPIGCSIRSTCGKSDGANCSLTSSTYGSQISSWIEQAPSASVSTANSKKPDEVGKTNRKRLKPGENPRPRPKDRQMIQDRVKELREIVPNGAKCSIDALLERTIKHMLFLQSVTKHADKLKQTVESKIINREGGMLLKDNFEGGATWAFELGSQSMVCPIVVEDLNPPRQLLIEMLCEERGFFLEIADLIRGLGLTILKGVMEARNDKIWARFAVEANRDVTRMEVFISLVHLLEQTLKGGTTPANGMKDENMGAHPVSIPATQQLVGPIVCGEPSAR